MNQRIKIKRGFAVSDFKKDVSSAVITTWKKTNSGSMPRKKGKRNEQVYKNWSVFEQIGTGRECKNG